MYAVINNPGTQPGCRSPDNCRETRPFAMVHACVCVLAKGLFYPQAGFIPSVRFRVRALRPFFEATKKLLCVYETRI